MAYEPTKRIALFPGTFDPFTIGHESLVTRGLELVDEIIVSIGINDKKLTYFSLEKRLEAIRNLYKDTPRVKVMSYNSLTVDFSSYAASGPSTTSSTRRASPTSTGSYRGSKPSSCSLNRSIRTSVRASSASCCATGKISRHSYPKRHYYIEPKETLLY